MGDVFSEPKKKRIAARKKGKLLRKKRVVGRFFEQKPFELGWIGRFFLGGGVPFFVGFWRTSWLESYPTKPLVVTCIRGSKWMCRPGFEAIWTGDLRPKRRVWRLSNCGESSLSNENLGL